MITDLPKFFFVDYKCQIYPNIQWIVVNYCDKNNQGLSSIYQRAAREARDRGEVFSERRVSRVKAHFEPEADHSLSSASQQKIHRAAIVCGPGSIWLLGSRRSSWTRRVFVHWFVCLFVGAPARTLFFHLIYCFRCLKAIFLVSRILAANLDERQTAAG